MFNTLLRRLRGRDRHQPDPNCPHPYGRELTAAEVARRRHRAFVGGKWDEIGQLQFDFLKACGLRPQHRLLDVGCGALRGGIHFIRYLDPGHYHGIDMNASLIRAGQTVELVEAGLQDRRPRLLVNDAFEFARFDAKFEFALAVSVFTHLPINSIQRCLINLAAVLEPGGRFYATYFEARRCTICNRCITLATSSPPATPTRSTITSPFSASSSTSSRLE